MSERNKSDRNLIVYHVEFDRVLRVDAVLVAGVVGGGGVHYLVRGWVEWMLLIQHQFREYGFGGREDVEFIKTR